MKFSFTLLTALAAPLLAAAAGTPTRRDDAPQLNPTGVALSDPFEVARASQPEPLSNAERLRRGLAPNAPRNLHAPSRAQPARRNDPSATPVKGAFKVFNADSGEQLGYLSKTLNIFGEVGITTDTTDALAISYTDSGNGFVDIAAADLPFPYLAFITGFANTSPDFGPGSFNYAYLGASTQTPPGSPPVNQPNSFTAATGIEEPVESAVWTIKNGEATAQWINTDGSSPSTTLVYYQPDNVVVATGDHGAFAANFGADNSPKIKLVYTQL